MKTKTKPRLIGAHTSAAGGAQNALYEGKAIGATTIQLFTANQRQWQSRALSEESIELWQKALAETGLKEIMSHDSYLINLGSKDEEIAKKSLHAFREEIKRCLQLNLAFMNFHPGTAVGQSRQECLDRIVKSLLSCDDLFTGKQPLRLLLECTAGQGATVGSSFEEIGYILDKVKKQLPIGVCIDTCHIFAAGYDIRTKEALDTTLKAFDKDVGLKHLYAFHLNDSLKGLASRVDRHADLGKGMIGIDCFKAIMQDPRLESLPMYLETPGGPAMWEKEIALLRSFCN